VDKIDDLVVSAEVIGGLMEGVLAMLSDFGQTRRLAAADI
jgi:hypothetical protein